MIPRAPCDKDPLALLKKALGCFDIVPSTETPVADESDGDGYFHYQIETSVLESFAENMARWRKTPEQVKKEIKEETDLVVAVRMKRKDEVQRLLDAGVSPDATEYNRSLYYASENYFTPLHYAAQDNSVEILSMLLRRQANPDAKDRYDVTPLHIAAKFGSTKCVQLLLEAGADCNASTKHPRTGLFPDAALPYPGGTTPLHLATWHNHVQCALELMWHGADYNLVDQYGHTSLYIAAEKGYSECVLKLLSNAIRTAILSIPVFGSGDTPLHECVRKGMMECIKELVKRGSDVGHQNHKGHSPLHLALMRDEFNFDLVKHLVIHGYNVDLNSRDRNGLTPLHYVSFGDGRSQFRRPEVAAFLIAMGAHPHILNKNGDTLLSFELRHFTNSPILTAIYESTPALKPLDEVFTRGSCSFRHRHRMTNHNHPRSNSTRYEEYEEIARSLPSLQHLTRCTVRKVMGPKRIRQARYLPLPSTLKEYLLLGQEIRDCTLT